MKPFIRKEKPKQFMNVNLCSVTRIHSPAARSANFSISFIADDVVDILQ